VDRYEQLRHRVLCGEPSGWQLGLGVLAARGVAGWLRVWHTTTVPTLEPVVPTAPVGLVSSDEIEMVGVLASMALACVTSGR